MGTEHGLNYYYYCQTYFVAISHFQNLTRILVQTHRCCRRCLKKNLSLNTCVLSIPTSNCLPKFECPIGPFSDKLRLVNLALRRLVAEDRPRLVSSLGPVVGNGYRRDLWFPLLGEPG